MSTSNRINKVAIVGAGGHSGSLMTKELLKTGKHTVTAITRHDSTTKLPERVQVTKVDYSKPTTIVEALNNRDALVITLSGFVPPDTQSKLIHAAAEAGVPWIFPNEWSPDTANEGLVKDVAMFQTKPASREEITKIGKSPQAKPAAYGFDFADRIVTFFDEGETNINTSTLPQVGRAVAGLLSLPIKPEGGDKERCLERFTNSVVYVSSFTVSQRDMLASILRVTGTKESDWKITKVSSVYRFESGVEAIKKGDRSGFAKMSTRVFYQDGCGNVEKTKGTVNSLLGLPEEDIDEFTKIAMEKSKMSPLH